MTAVPVAAPGPSAARGVAARFAALAVVGLAVVIGLGMLAFAAAGPLAIAAGAGVFVVGASVATRQLHRHHGHARLGGANAVTLLRLALVSALSIPLFGALLAGAPPAEGPATASLAIIVIATVSLSLDGVDGYLARRQGLATAFGGRFDMEVDSVFALVLATLAAVSGGPWIVLLLGLPRYLFWVAGAIWPWLYGPLPPRYSGKVVAVIQLITLIVLQLPGLPHPLAIVVTIGVLGALGWSFGRDIVYLWRRRPVAERE